MEVIMLKDQKGVGKKGQIVKVSDGYANNFLIPRGVAVMKTSVSISQLEKQKEKERIDNENKVILAKEVALKLKNITVSFEASVGKDGKMFGSVSPKQVEEALKKDYGIDIDKRKLINSSPINEIGYAKLQIELAKGVVGEINVHVIAKGN